MLDPVKHAQFLRIALTAGGIVLVVWFVVLVTAFTIWWRDPPLIASLGQLGDTFGLLNAGFTGLALAGVVYTALLQRGQTDAQTEQIKLQKQELMDQRLESVDSRRAMRRQSREQLLSAKLQAETALLQAESARWEKVDPAVISGNQYLSLEYQRSLARRRIAVQLLLLEAQQGFDAAQWSASIQLESIRRLLVEWSRLHVHRYERLLPEFRAPYAMELMANETKQGRLQIDVLIEDFADDFPDLRNAVSPMTQALELYETDRDASIKNLKGAEVDYLSKASPAWARLIAQTDSQPKPPAGPSAFDPQGASTRNL
jgi:hypothetical protein